MKNKNFLRLLLVIFVCLNSVICWSSLEKTINYSDFLHNTLQEEYEALEKIRGEDDSLTRDIWINIGRVNTNTINTNTNTNTIDTLALTKPEIFISLGMNCICARNFEQRKLSEAFFPFDWNITQADSIYRILENDFKDFLKQDNLVIQQQENLDLKPTNHPWLKAYHVLDTLYNIKIVHDFTKKGPALHDYEHVKNKYYRRVARFYKALSLNRPIYFFRTVITKEEAIKLNNLIQKKFPLLTYTLVVVNNTQEFKQPWKIKNIKNFFLKTAASSGGIKQWDKIFKALKITKKVPTPIREIPSFLYNEYTLSNKISVPEEDFQQSDWKNHLKRPLQKPKPPISLVQ